jgi:hypothetical protein
MFTRSLACLALVPLCASLAAAQERPDLTGTWKADKAAPPSAAPAPTPVFGPEIEVRHDGNRLTIVRPVRDVLVSASYTLDGREEASSVPGGVCQGDTRVIETAAWEGEAIVVTIVGLISPGASATRPMEVRRLFRLQDASTLVVEGTTRRDGKPVQVGTVYKRTPESLKGSGSALPAVAKAPATIAQLGWIAGVWTGTAGQSTVEERWTPPAGGAMLAISRTLRNETMSAFEFLCIAERDGSLVYSAMPSARSPATHFMLTSITADAATFENPSHDYPKLIRYAKKPDGSLETTIAGESGQRAQSVTLKK